MPDFSYSTKAMQRNGFDPASLPGWRMLVALVVGKPAKQPPAPLASKPPAAMLRRLASRSRLSA